MRNLFIISVLLSITNSLRSQSNVYMDGQSFNIDIVSAECVNSRMQSYTVTYLDLIGETEVDGEKINIFHKMQLHEDQCHDAAIKYGIDRDKPFGMNVNDALDLKTTKPLFINFAFSGCPPCLKEIPIINKLYEIHKEEYTFLVITPDKDITKLRSRFHADIEIITMSDMNITFQFLVNYYPATYITDKQQNIQWSIKEIKSDFIGSYTYDLIF